jgi:hypothetical protein
MPRTQSIPAYRRHKQSGQAIVTLTDPFGNRRDVLLGTYNTALSRSEYARVIGEWEQHGRRLPTLPGKLPDISVNEVMVAYLQYATGYYVKDGKPTGQLDRVKRSIRVLRELYGHTRASEFGPLALKTVRENMIKVGLCRKVINQRVEHPPGIQVECGRGVGTRCRALGAASGAGTSSWPHRGGRSSANRSRLTGSRRGHLAPSPSAPCRHGSLSDADRLSASRGLQPATDGSRHQGPGVAVPRAGAQDPAS